MAELHVFNPAAWHALLVSTLLHGMSCWCRPCARGMPCWCQPCRMACPVAVNPAAWLALLVSTLLHGMSCCATLQEAEVSQLAQQLQQQRERAEAAEAATADLRRERGALQATVAELEG